MTVFVCTRKGAPANHQTAKKNNKNFGVTGYNPNCDKDPTTTTKKKERRREVLFFGRKKREGRREEKNDGSVEQLLLLIPSLYSPSSALVVVTKTTKTTKYLFVNDTNKLTQKVKEVPSGETKAD